MLNKPKFVVGVGASAGGLEALQEFFAAIPARTDCAFVVLQHLSPDFKSMMSEILAHDTEMPIAPVEEGKALTADTVFLSVPRRNVTVDDGVLRLAEPNPVRGVNFSINEFYHSLAATYGPNAIAVVLSGTGSDGAEGVRAVVEAGGFAIAQTKESAAFDGMPRAAVGTGMISWTGTPAQLAGELLRHIDHEAAPLREPQSRLAVTERLEEIVGILRDGGQHNFSAYRATTLARRVERRLTTLGVKSINDYIDVLTRSPKERTNLAAELLIGVTRFFRDPEKWEQVTKKAFREIIARRDGLEPARIWCAGCSTGEEAYTITMLLTEVCQELGRRANFKVFATDIDQNALEIAGAGSYRRHIEDEISQDRLEAFFEDNGTGYDVRRFLRDKIVFAAHNVVEDPPFSRIDFLSCRNLLIYLESFAQRQLLAQLHFALVKNGYLFLGPSESLGQMSEAFETLDESVRLFRKRTADSPRMMRLHSPVDYTSRFRVSAQNGVTATPRASASRHLPNEHILQFIAANVAEPGVVIGDDNRLVFTFGDITEVVRIPAGEITLEAFAMISDDLRPVTVSTVRQARSKEEGPIVKDTVIGERDARRACRIRAWRLSADGDSTATVLTYAIRPLAAANAPDDDELQIPDQTEYVRTLEAELLVTRQSLQETVEELETSNEELQSSNEELIASNEELQSTNEELHSVNEELHTVNTEFQQKIKELTQVSADFENILETSEVGVVFCDRDLSVRKYTPAAAKILPLLEHDIGRSILTFNMPFKIPDLEELCRQAMSARTALSREVVANDGSIFVFAVFPFMAAPELVTGIVIKLTDISALREADAAKMRSIEQFEAVLDLAPVPMLVVDSAAVIQKANQALCDLFAYKLSELVGRPAASLFGGSSEIFNGVASVEDFAAAAATRSEDGRLLLGVARDGRSFPVTLEFGATAADPASLSPIIVRDLEAGARVETELKSALARLKQSNRELERFGSVVAHDLKEPLRAVVGYSKLLKADASRQLDDEAQRYLDRIVAGSLRMQLLIDDLLTLASVDSDETPRRMTPLSNLVSIVRERLATVLDQSGAALKVETLPDWLVNPNTMTQLFQNLIANAIKYRSDEPLNIYISATIREDSLMLSVRDNGIGVPDEYRERIFEVFTRIGPKDKDGSGIGLAICKKIAEQHGGEIWVEANPNGGSVFKIRIPRG